MRTIVFMIATILAMQTAAIFIDVGHPPAYLLPVQEPEPYKQDPELVEV
jgi:hypothetical protein